MSSIKNSVKVVKLLCNIYECRNDGWISLSVLRGAISNRQNRDVDVNIYIPNILFCESVDFNSGMKVQYLGMETEEVSINELNQLENIKCSYPFMPGAPGVETMKDCLGFLRRASQEALVRKIGFSLIFICMLLTYE